MSKLEILLLETRLAGLNGRITRMGWESPERDWDMFLVLITECDEITTKLAPYVRPSL